LLYLSDRYLGFLLFVAIYSRQWTYLTFELVNVLMRRLVDSGDPYLPTLVIRSAEKLLEYGMTKELPPAVLALGLSQLVRIISLRSAEIELVGRLDGFISRFPLLDHTYRQLRGEKVTLSDNSIAWGDYYLVGNEKSPWVLLVDGRKLIAIPKDDIVVIEPGKAFVDIRIKACVGSEELVLQSEENEPMLWVTYFVVATRLVTRDLVELYEAFRVDESIDTLVEIMG
jgi:hypothetical protein